MDCYPNSYSGGNGTGKRQPDGQGQVIAEGEPPTWSELYDFAFGELQLRPKAFEKLTPATYYRMVAGYYRRLEDLEEPVRKLARVMADINRPADHPGYQPEDMWPLRKDAIPLLASTSQSTEEPFSLEKILALDNDLFSS